MTRIAGVFVALCFLAPSFSTERASGSVIAVIDGDTLKIDLGGQQRTVRVIGIDAPELHHPREALQYLASASSQALAELALGQIVRLVPDERVGVDRFGRDLAYVELADGTDLGAQLLSRGLARVLTKFPFSRKAKYLEFERGARAAGRGVWAEDGLAEFRWLSTKESLTIDVVPLSGARFAVRWADWVRLDVSSRQLADAIWTARRAAGMQGSDPAAAERELRAAGFRNLSAADPAPSRPRREKGRARQPGSRPEFLDRPG